MAIPEEEIHKGDIGTVFEVTVMEKDATTGLLVVVDISTATLMQIKFKKPDGTTDTQTAVFTNAGADGKIEYVSVLTDLDQVGNWKLQGYVEMPAWQGHTSIGECERTELL